MNEFSRKLLLSGYSLQERYNAIKGSIVRYNQMKADVKPGKISDLYRHKNQIFRSKFDKKSWANAWFLKGEVSGTISCQATPNGEWSKAI